MIQWIALAMAVDAEGKADGAKRAADEANDTAHKGLDSRMVIISDFDFSDVPSRERSFFDKLLGLGMKRVINENPTCKFAIKRSDILNLREKFDDNGTAFVYITISKYAKIPGSEEGSVRVGSTIPGTLEEVAKVLG